MTQSSPRSAKVAGKAVLLLAGGAALFAAGVYVGTGPANRPAVVPGEVQRRPAEDGSSLQSHLARVNGQVRQLLRQREELEEAAREARVAAALLRARGHAADSPLCREQQARQQQVTTDLADLKRQVEEALQLEKELLEVRERLQERGRSEAEDPTWREAARAFLIRKALLHNLEEDGKPPR
jgi:flagellar motility protein MotE (MotC chaperone)